MLTLKIKKILYRFYNSINKLCKSVVSSSGLFTGVISVY